MNAPLALAIETTGLRADRGHRIVQIAVASTGLRLPCSLASVATGGGVADVWWANLDPQRAVDPAATAIHGLTEESLRGAHRFGSIVGELLTNLMGRQLVIHNAAFDLGFLDAELYRDGLDPTGAYCEEIVDSLAVARDRWPGEKHTLRRIAERLGVTVIETGTKALTDALTLARCWAAMHVKETAPC